MSRPARDRVVPTVTAVTTVTTVTTGLAVLGIAAFAAYKLWQCLVGEPLVWQDSLTYEALGSRPLWSHDLWAGARPVVTPLFWKGTGTPADFVVAQTVLSIAAWTTLAVVVGRLARRAWPRLVAGGLVLGFAATTPIVQWDRSVLSESISLSLLALLFATAILWARAATPSRAAAFVGVALVFAAVRDTHIWVIALLAIALGLYAAWRSSGGRRAHPGRAAHVAWVAAALGVVVLLTAWSSAVAHRTRPNVNNVYAVRVFPYADRIDWFADHGMPQRKLLHAYARNADGIDGNAPIVGLDLGDPSLRALDRWLRDDGAATYVRWLLTHPGYVVGEPFERPERTFNNAEGHLTFYAAPDRTELSAVDLLLYPPWWAVLVEAVVAIGGAVRLRRWRDHGWQISALLGAIGVVHMLVAWHGDGMEVTRHAAIGNVQVRVAVLIALGYLLPRTTEERQSTGDSIRPRWPSLRR